ncbi:MAG TPA: histidinol-phosphate transaminase, partial [Thermoanaerobaculia bacterium]|nr:histidinol-phosphate transaminase [Thermoanaerobaculia bacterium]
MGRALEWWKSRIRQASEFTARCLDGRLVPYDDEALFDLSFNENPLRASPAALREMARLLPYVHRYPNVSSPRLTAALAARYSIPESCIVVGAGVTQLCSHIGYALLPPDGNVVLSQGALFSYFFTDSLFGTGPRVVPLLGDLRQDVPGFLRAMDEQTRLLFIASPNNPTGLEIGEQELRVALETITPETVLALDQAYIHYREAYTDDRWPIAEAASRPNLIILRTFSKIHGLAGMRVGFAVCAPPLAERIRTVQRHMDPSTVTLLSEGGAMAALSDQEHFDQSRQHVLRERAEALAALRRHGIACTESQANFLFVNVGNCEDEILKTSRQGGFLV